MRRVMAAVAVTVVMTLFAGPALAADSGAMIVLPAEGTIDTPIDVVTAGVCTRGVTFVVAVRGRGLDPTVAGNAVGNTDLTVLEPAFYPGHHTVPLARSFREFFVSNGVSTPIGQYDLVFACRNRLDLADLQTFSATVRIDKSGAYRAEGAAATPLDEFLVVPTDADSGEPTEQSHTADSPTPQGELPSSSPGEPGEPGRQSEPAQPGAPAQLTEPSPPAGEVHSVTSNDDVAMAEAAATLPVQQDNTWRFALIGLGIILLSGAGYMGWKARTR